MKAAHQNHKFLLSVIQWSQAKYVRAQPLNVELWCYCNWNFLKTTRCPNKAKGLLLFAGIGWFTVPICSFLSILLLAKVIEFSQILCHLTDWNQEFYHRKCRGCGGYKGEFNQRILEIWKKNLALSKDLIQSYNTCNCIWFKTTQTQICALYI